MGIQQAVPSQPPHRFDNQRGFPGASLTETDLTDVSTGFCDLANSDSFAPHASADTRSNDPFTESAASVVFQSEGNDRRHVMFTRTNDSGDTFFGREAAPAQTEPLKIDDDPGTAFVEADIDASDRGFGAMGQWNGVIWPDGRAAIGQVEMDARLGSMTDPLDETESRCIERILDEFRYLEEEFCTWCNYCMPCPEGVNIPFILDCRKKMQVYKLLHWARGQYQSLPPEERADRCTQCGECETKCPNQLPIIERVEEAHEKLSV